MVGVSKVKGRGRLGFEKYSPLWYNFIGNEFVRNISRIWFVEENHWIKACQAKNIHLLDEMSKEACKDASNQWKALVLAFLDNGNHLAWMVGDGSQVKLGVNAIMGCERKD